MPATGFQSQRISSGAPDAARSPRSGPAESVVAFPTRLQHGNPAVPAESGNFFPRSPACRATPGFASDCPRRVPGMLVAVLLHAALLSVLFRDQSTPPALMPPRPPVMVELIAEARPEAATPPVPQPVEPVKTKIQTPKPKRPPKPKPVPPKVRRPPVLSAPVEVPTPAASAEREIPAPEPSVATAPPPRAAAPAPVSPPRFNADYLHNPAPVYPALSRSRGEEGRVVLRVLVDAEGRAGQIEIRSSSGHERLDDAARATVKQWKFVPARQGDQPVPAWVLVPISFSLEE